MAEFFSNTETRTIVNDMIKMSASVLTKTSQNCTSPVSTVQAISVSGCDTVNISGNELRNSISVNLACVQNSAVDNKVSTLIDSQFQQMAETTEQALKLRLKVGSDKITESISNLTKDLSSTIINEFVQNCAPSIFTNQSIAVSDCKTANIVDNKLINDVNTLVDCLQNSSAVSGVANDLQTLIDQVASSREEPWIDLGMIIALIAGAIIFIIAIIGLVLIFSLKSGSKVATALVSGGKQS